MTDLKMVFLGTSSAIPTGQRGLSSTAVIRGGEIILFDAGEGTQRSFAEAGLGFSKKMKIFITHMHGDHCVGLLGMLQTMSMLNRTSPLSVYGPKGLLSFVKNNIRSLKFGLTFPLEIITVREGVVVEEKDYLIRACRGEHNIITYAYVLEEKGRPGVFHPEKAKRLGVPEGALWSKLQNGETIKIDGRTVHPNQVLGLSRPGRKIAVSGDTRPTAKLRRCINGADIAALD
jgi:ribonuclease Z